MSRHHTSNTQEIEHMVMDAKNMSDQELKDTYNIEREDDGSIFDTMLNQTFKDARDWANFIVDQDGSEYDDLVDDKYTSEGEYN